MYTTPTQPTWGLTGERFLWLYGALCLGAAIWIWLRRRAADGPAPAEPEPELSIHELALLGGGPQQAITSAATQLMRDGAIKRGASDGTLDVAGELGAGGDPLEAAVFAAVSRQPGLSVDAMRADVLASAALTTMQTELVDARLLLSERAARTSRRQWLIGAALLAFGGLRLLLGMADEQPVAALFLMVLVVGYATRQLFHSRRYATRHGRTIVDRWRRSCGDPQTQAVSGDRALATALFGGGVLWLAEPEIASAFGLPVDWRRESAWGSGGGGGGGCGGGCGGCGGCGG